MKYFVIAIFFFAGCKKNETATGNYIVKGNLQGNLSNVSVTLEGVATYKTITDNNGNFEIKGIEKGMYFLNYKQVFSDSSFRANSLRLNITNDTSLTNLLLPAPVRMYAATGISSNSANLSWSKCFDPGFYEYKIYRKENSGLDETTGTLVHVSTNANDTSFADTNLSENSDYYYRVYVMNNYGKLGGSNLVNFNTLNGTYLLNGSFENFNGTVATDWNNFQYSKVVLDSSSPDGIHCLSIDIPVYHYALSFGDIYQLPTSVLQSGIKYELSGWINVKELGNGAEIYLEAYGSSYIAQQRITIPSSVPRNQWIRYSTKFYGTNDGSLKVQLLNMCPIPYNGEPYKILIDNIVLQKTN